MPRPASSTPTEGELDILQVLWQNGPSTVRQLHNALKDKRGTGYSTTLKMVQVMTEKGLLLKDESVRPQVFRPAESQEETQLALVDNLILRGFGGSAMELVLRAVSAKRITSDELAKIKRLIEKAKGGRR
jgi:BlaI family transcriptional regulator, penicillinase repressor